MAKKILLADDSITIQKVVELTFSEGDYEVHSVGNGALAIRKIDEIVPDIALVDVMMPQRNGYEVCSHIKQDPKLAWIPVLLLTGTFEPFDPRRAEQAGADGHITKPFESRALVAQVEDLLAAHPRPRSAETERMPIVPARAPENSEVFNAGQILAPAPAGPPAPHAPPVADAASSSPATVRIDSRTFFSQLAAGNRGGEVLETPQQAETPSLGPFDLAGDERDTEPTGPIQVVPKPPAAPEAPRRASVAEPAPAAPRSAAPESAHGPSRISDDEMTRLVQERIQALVKEGLPEILDRVIREIAWEVLPETAERIVKERIRELESEAGGGAASPMVH